MKNIFLLAALLMTMNVQAQFGYGFTLSNDLYNRYVNPKNDNWSASSGSAMLNLGAGPKIWIGGKKFSFSAEGQAVLGILSLSTKQYKGLGSVAFPIMGKLNFNGLSTFEREGKLGFSIGGGIQYNKTELWGVTDEFQAKGLQRDFFVTYVAQAGIGFGVSGFTLHGFVRYGINPDDKSSNSLNVGIQYDFNRPMMKKIKSPESAL
ncbi:MAG: hypothetical protein J5I52_11590 [Saprospiraceae bacterium]|nr:hypothetical protein [Saprospiraceae bacterium]MCZ2336618.1 hypothetical protein [Chitinophagales bacterium]